MKKTGFILIAIYLFSTNVFTMVRRPIIAEINGEPIYRDTFEQEWKQQSLFVGKISLSKKRVLYSLIDRKIGIQKALKYKLNTNEIVQRKMYDVLFHAQVSKDLENKFKTIKITNSDLKNYYNKFPEYRTAHILFRYPANPSEMDRNLAMTQSIKIYHQLEKNPSQFATLANQYSQISASKNGGDIGFQLADKLAPEYFKEIHQKKIGYISSPVETQFGFHIIKLIGKKSFKGIHRPTYQSIVYKIKRDKLMHKYFAASRKKAIIIIKDKTLN